MSPPLTAGQQLIVVALGAHAERLLRLARSREYAGPWNSTHREGLRDTARQCDALAAQVRACDPQALAAILQETGKEGPAS